MKEPTPIDNQSGASGAAERDQMQRTIVNSATAAAKAIAAMHMLRLTRPPKSKGQGANRDDHPIFSSIFRQWRDQESLEVFADDRDSFYTAVARLEKYARQLCRSKYSRDIINGSVSLREFLDRHAPEAEKYAAEVELMEHVAEKEAENYGIW